MNLNRVDRARRYNRFRALRSRPQHAKQRVNAQIARVARDFAQFALLRWDVLARRRRALTTVAPEQAREGAVLNRVEARMTLASCVLRLTRLVLARKVELNRQLTMMMTL